MSRVPDWLDRFLGRRRKKLGGKHKAAGVCRFCGEYVASDEPHARWHCRQAVLRRIAENLEES